MLNNEISYEIFKTPRLYSVSFYSSNPLATDTININTADKETLMTVITGVGEKKADAIIEYRGKNRPFKSIDELMNIKGIGQGTVDKHRNMLSVADR